MVRSDKKVIRRRNADWGRYHPGTDEDISIVMILSRESSLFSVSLEDGEWGGLRGLAGVLCALEGVAVRGACFAKNRGKAKKQACWHR